MNFDLGHFTFFSQSFFLCVIYPEEGQSEINTQKGLSQSFFSLWKLSLRQILKNFYLEHFMFFFFILFFFSLYGSTSRDKFDFINFPFNSYFFFSLCKIPPGESQSTLKHKTDFSQSFFSLWILSLRQTLLNFDLGHIVFFSLSLFSLCVRFLAIFVDVWSS